MSWSPARSGCTCTVQYAYDCPACTAATVEAHRSTAWVRGGRWVERVLWHHPELAAQPWQDAPKARRGAGEQIGDLAARWHPAHQPLLDHVLIGAGERWTQLQAPEQLATLRRCAAPRKPSR